jgi:signal transduction histidine kinase
MNTAPQSAQDEARRRRAVQVMAWFVLPFSPLVGGGLWFLGEPLPGLAVLATAPACVGAIAIARSGGSVAIANHLLVFGLVQGLWFSSWLLGGVSSPPTQWLVLAPVMATAAGGVRAGLQWTAIIIGLALLLLGIQLQGYVAIPYVFDGWEWLGTFTAIGLYGLMGGFLWTNDALYQELLRRVREAEIAERDASKAKSDFLANMSHELRTPLNAILGYSELVAEDAESLGRDDMVEDLGRVQDSGRHLLGLLNDILDLSKIEAGRMELVVESVAVEQVVHAATDAIGPLLAANGNRLQVHVEPHSTMADRVRLTQCMINLLSNASKFTHNGVVRVRAQDGVLEVSDTGIGMSPEQLAVVFEPFVQADVSTSHTYGGTGLGLAIVERLVRQMGGTIQAQSAIGEGTTMTITLPQARPM